MKACVVITSYSGRNVKNYFWKGKIASVWVTNGTLKIKLLNDQIRSITHEVGLSELTHESPLIN